MRLYVNVDHVATLRQARRATEPDVVSAALACEAAGAEGITVHLREDRRHIQDADLPALAEAIGTVLNVELAVAPEIVTLVAALRPFQATLVPERREELTTEGGLDLGRNVTALARALETLTSAGIRTSLFIDPEVATIDAAAALGVSAVELHTGEFSRTWQESPTALAALARAARHARERGLAVHAGHGLNYQNTALVAALQDIEELNIGHSIVARAITCGLHRAVSEMRTLVRRARPSH